MPLLLCTLTCFMLMLPQSVVLTIVDSDSVFLIQPCNQFNFVSLIIATSVCRHLIGTLNPAVHFFVIIIVGDPPT